MKSKEQISYNMSRVKSKDTTLEIALRTELWKRGLRYRKNVTSIFGKPDIVFIKKRIAVFVDSEFWHGYDWENRKKDFKTNQAFWMGKIERNIQRDAEVTARLQDDGWLVLRYWGKEIKTNLSGCADDIEKAFRER